MSSGASVTMAITLSWRIYEKVYGEKDFSIVFWSYVDG